MYQYGWLDKVTQITEGDKVIRSFRYHMDGQLAAAYDGSNTETFLWDGLALIRRDTTNYLNEPAVTGGNPVIAGEKTLFNDLLGSTLGAKSADGFSAIKRDAFGEVKPGETADLGINFFTGKPQVEGLGYTFLFRNYRPDQGKWQTADPLGYPDGWNNLAYVNNGVTMNIDWLGGCTLFSTCPERTDADYRTETVTQIINNDILCVVTVGCSAGSNKCEPQGSLDFSFDITGNYWGINFNVKGSYSIKHVQHEVAAYVCSSEMHDGSGQKSVKYEVNTWVVLTKHERTCGEKYITQQEYYEWKNSAKMTKCE